MTQVRAVEMFSKSSILTLPLLSLDRLTVLPCLFHKRNFRDGSGHHYVHFTEHQYLIEREDCRQIIFILVPPVQTEQRFKALCTYPSTNIEIINKPRNVTSLKQGFLGSVTCHRKCSAPSGNTDETRMVNQDYPFC